MSDCAHFRELLGGYVLEALEPDEAQALERHLRGLSALPARARRAGGRPGAAGHARLARRGSEAPPPGLEEAVLDRFARERRRLNARSGCRRGGWGLRLGLAGAVRGGRRRPWSLAGVFSSSRDDSAFGHVPAERRQRRPRRTRSARAARGHRRATCRFTGLRRARRAASTSSGAWTDDGRWISGGTFRVDRHGRAHVVAHLRRPARASTSVMLVTRRADAAREARLAGTVEY